ncbi:glutathione S-transferase family protein [Leptospira alstonii]|uniref:Glutathione S-transferase, N-terminal domain protein n=2 Tax=Leptospira alstonii TaxID=28452 RepID=M6CPF8_9LEPT|nr:glutathione S-transferase [Leptospira alstonii]EMJ93614.1 glutathione S-transferase, N-terminal domain protein [Leptospira alstonii serovar Sichuan str. 79601]EQA81432.1 glutathione S-transferase [Leptospira alstonii serovar Pingchang str. 80-412]
MKLFEFDISGNSHKVRLLLSMLNLEYKSHPVNRFDREQKSENFLRMNPFGQVPVLKDKEILIRDSQAILVYLAIEYGGDKWLPKSGAGTAKVMEWLSTAANEVARGPAALRVYHKFGQSVNVEEATAITDRLLKILENHLDGNLWLADAKITIADIAMYPYLALSNEGKVDLRPYEKIRSWMRRIETLPGFISMPGIKLQNV